MKGRAVRSHEPFCEVTSRTTGLRCQQPERWLVRVPIADERWPMALRVCQVHGKQLERRGGAFARELHPVPGIPERTA